MKLLTFILFTSTCYPAAGLQLRVLHSIWPHTAAIGHRSACILADPDLLKKLPLDIAIKILTENDKKIYQEEEERKARFKIFACQIATGNLPASARKVFEQHMPTENLKAGRCSTEVAYGFTFDDRLNDITMQNLHPKFSLWNKPLSYPSNSRLFLRIPNTHETEIKEDYNLNNFIKEPHIKMLEQRGEAQAVEELINEEVKKVRRTSKLIACLKWTIKK